MPRHFRIGPVQHYTILIHTRASTYVAHLPACSTSVKLRFVQYAPPYHWGFGGEPCAAIRLHMSDVGPVRTQQPGSVPHLFLVCTCIADSLGSTLPPISPNAKRQKPLCVGTSAWQCSLLLHSARSYKRRKRLCVWLPDEFCIQFDGCPCQRFRNGTAFLRGLGVLHKRIVVEARHYAFSR